MTEEIIIDGVNVAGCEHHLSTGYCQLQMIFQGMVLKLPFGKHLECNLCDKDCYFKQLKRLEQENKELKEDLKSQQMINLEQQEIALDYWNALEEIKKDFMCFRTCMLPFHIGNKENLPHNIADTIQDYCESIKNKINEVLNDSES